jgi:hypothetical protein
MTYLFDVAMREYPDVRLRHGAGMTAIMGQYDFILDSTRKCAVEGVFAAEPTAYEQRQSAQQAVFLVPCDLRVGFEGNLAAAYGAVFGPKQPAVKILIPESARLEALKDLDRMNVNAAVLFPGLDGLARQQRVRLAWSQ